MKWFGGSSKNDQQYQQVAETDAIPVATLVTDAEALPDDEEAPPPPPAASVEASARPPPTAPPASSTTTTTTSDTSPIILLDPCLLSRNPIQIRTCPNCQLSPSRTRIETYPTMQSWILAFILLLAFWPICWIPLVLDSCKRTNHYCTACGVKVGQLDAFYDCCVKRRG